MKKCEYCAKEISYHEQYCGSECALSADKYYRNEIRMRKPFGAIQIICVILLMVGLVASMFNVFWGTLIAGCASLILGVMIFILPLGTYDMIKKYKIKKMIFITRCFAGVLMLFGVLVIIIGQMIR